MLHPNRPLPVTMRALDEETYKNAAAAAGLAFKVFLAGPYIETTGKKPGHGAKNKAKRLRYGLHAYLSEIGWTVTMGEYEKLIDAAQPLLGGRTTAANAEIIHAKTHADAVVMLPCSPGSFLELGAFAIYAEVCSKMLILVDKIYENDPPNYLNSGPLRSAQDKGAKIIYADYGDTADCWNIVKDFVVDQGNRVAERKMLAI
jgi:hypothetical protein